MHRPDASRPRLIGGPRARRLVFAMAFAALVGSVGSVVSAAPSAQAATRYTTLARGVVFWRQVYHPSAHHSTSVTLMRINLRTRGLHLDADTDRHQLAAPRESISSMANQGHAVGGVNADFFDTSSSTSVPRGGVIRDGNVLKTPVPGWQSNFFVRSNGTAGIGAIPFVGTLSRGSTAGRPGVTTSIYSIDDLADAASNRITLVRSNLLYVPLATSCVSVLVLTADGRRTVTAVRTGIRRLPRQAANSWALISCGGRARTWLLTKLRVHDRIYASVTFTGAPIRTAVAGGRVLVVRGRAYDDKGGEVLGSSAPNPETFGCVSQSGSYVLLGAIDGRSRVSAGVTYTQLTRYLLSLHCYSGMVFDGGGSTTMVGRLPGHRSVSVLDIPSDGTQRLVPDGLFVYAS